jgi:hypothetical protein
MITLQLEHPPQVGPTQEQVSDKQIIKMRKESSAGTTTTSCVRGETPARNAVSLEVESPRDGRGNEARKNHLLVTALAGMNPRQIP